MMKTEELFGVINCFAQNHHILMDSNYDRWEFSSW